MKPPSINEDNWVYRQFMREPEMSSKVREFYFAERCSAQDRADRQAWRVLLTGAIIYTDIGKYPPCVHYRVQADGHKMLCRADGRRSVFDDVDE